MPPCVVNLFDISDWKVGWLEVAVGLPIVIPGGGRTTLLRLPAAGDIIVNLHKLRIEKSIQGLQRLLRPLLW